MGLPLLLAVFAKSLDPTQQLTGAGYLLCAWSSGLVPTKGFRGLGVDQHQVIEEEVWVFWRWRYWQSKWQGQGSHWDLLDGPESSFGFFQSVLQNNPNFLVSPIFYFFFLQSMCCLRLELQRFMVPWPTAGWNNLFGLVSNSVLAFHSNSGSGLFCTASANCIGWSQGENLKGDLLAHSFFQVGLFYLLIFFHLGNFNALLIHMTSVHENVSVE